MTAPLLTIRNLTVTLAGQPQQKIIDGVSFDVPPLSIVALVGGSGSGIQWVGLPLGALPHEQWFLNLQASSPLAQHAIIT